MKTQYFTVKDVLFILAASLALGALLAFIEDGNWWIGFVSFSFLFFLSLTILTLSSRWANAGRRLALIVALAFFLRFAVGMALHLALPVYGHEDADDRAGYVFTDAHRRDDQAWNLATSEYPVIDAFSAKYGSDQYGGLLAFNTFVYRYFSPDAHRPLMLVLLSAFFAALGVPFFWKAVRQIFGERIAWVSTWIFALFPESILLGASAMREPYLLTFNTLVLWGFIKRFIDVNKSNSTKQRDIQSLLKERGAWIWIALGLLGMLLVSPAVALATILIFAGWIFFTNEQRQISWRAITGVALLFILGLFFLSSSLNRSGEFYAGSPLHVINGWFQSAVKWDAYQLERDSGWVQKIFDEAPRWVRLPFIAGYGILQPILPATIIYPTKSIWKLILIPLGFSWYAMLPLLILSFVAAAAQSPGKKRSLILWLSLVTWIWILLAALRGGADLWDNPRYRTILLVWQSILAGYVWVWWREARSIWVARVLWMEVVFLLFFTQWYISRYFHWGGQLPFPVMVALILGVWGAILIFGWWQDKRRTAVPRVPGTGSVDRRSSPVGKRRA
jgi:hypothetical protein